MPDEQAQERLLTDYLAAVQAGDRARIGQMCTPGVDATAEIDAAVSAVGGRQWRNVEVSWRRGDLAGAAVADVTAKDGTGKPIAMSVPLAKVDDRWWIALGSAVTDPGTPPAHTSPPG
ncbi:hypothetical protein V6U89_12380 [Micromonospora sp. CPCC 206171]|uniref:hypothetical protein n=1 Tax=Micromonospora sp. CPCC 206171 TaxID=3122405 RepID=UPI002FF1053A